MGSVFVPKPVTKAECLEMQKEGLVSGCKYETDYWAGAVKQCGGVANMPTMSDLAKIASAIYEGNPSIGAYDNVDNLTYKSGTATSLGLPEPDFYLWSGEESSYGVTYHRDFTPTGSHWIFSYGHRRDGSNIQAVCLVD